MPLQKLPTSGLDDVNQRRRRIETLNNVLDFTFDDSRIQTPAEKLAGVTPVNYAYAVLYPRRYGAAANGTTDDHTPITTAISVGSQIGGLCYIDLEGLTYAVSASVNIPTNIVLVNGSLIYTGSTADTAIVQIGITGGGALVRPGGAENIRLSTASTASGLVGFRMDSFVRSSWFRSCYVQMNEDGTGTRGHIGYELIAERLAVSASTGCYQNEITGCTANNCYAAVRMKTRGTGAQQLADPQVNGNRVEVFAYSCIRSAIIMEEGALENRIRIRADTFVGQIGSGTTIYVAEIKGLYNEVVLYEEIGVRADTQYSLRLGADSAYNIIRYHTQNVGTARMLNDSTTNRNAVTWLRPSGNIGGDLVTHAHYVQGVTVGTTQSIVAQWVAPAPCVIVRGVAKLDSAVLTAGNFDAYFAKNGSFSSSNRVQFAVGEGTTAKYLEGDPSAGTPIASELVLAKGDTLALAVTNSGTGGSLSCTFTFVARFLSTESDG